MTRYQDLVADCLWGDGDGSAAAFLPRRLFSLRYGGRDLDSTTLPRTVHTDDATTATAGVRRLDVTYDVDPGVLELHLSVRIFHDRPVIEYTPVLHGVGDRPSDIVEDLFMLDYRLPLLCVEREPRLLSSHLGVRYNLGSDCAFRDFVAMHADLWNHPGSRDLELRAVEGRSSSTFMPYFGVDYDDLHGVNVAVGWSGAWKAQFRNDGQTGRIAVSMLNTHFRVLPGECLRQPSFCLQFRDGIGIRAAQNVFRRHMLAVHSPRDSRGELLTAPISFVTWGGMQSTNMLDRIRVIREQQLPYDVFWIDAGWSGFDGKCPHHFETHLDGPSDWPIRVGNWRINRSPHPQGLRPVSDAAHAAGMKFLAWFEPERVHRKSQAAVLREHPEWLVGKDDNLLLNLGAPDAWQWLLNTLKDIIDEEGIDYYRQDFNFNTLPYWAQMDAPDRVGVAEMKHIDGLYRLWDALRETYPDMLIDNCASGGRRLDFELLSRSIPLWQSDLQCYPDHRREGSQVENFYLHDWLPQHAGCSWLPENDDYDVLSMLATGVSLKPWGTDNRRPGLETNWDFHRRALAIARRVRPILRDGDYYPLSDRPEDLSHWCAYQAHLPEDDRGMVMAFRRPECPAAQQSYALQGLSPDAIYELQWTDGHSDRRCGADLATGLRLELPLPRSCALCFYQRLRSKTSHP